MNGHCSVSCATSTTSGLEKSPPVFWAEYLEPMSREHPEINFHELLAPTWTPLKKRQPTCSLFVIG
jgi:hypothetical protein